MVFYNLYALVANTIYFLMLFKLVVFFACKLMKIGWLKSKLILTKCIKKLGQYLLL